MSMLILSADVGATHCRLGLWRGDELIDQATPLTAAEPPAAAARRFAAGRPLAAACLAVAGPVVNGVAELTNAGWTIAEDEVAAALGCPALIVNDFVGAARGVTALGPDGFTHLHGPAPQRGLIGVLGAGTGLGQALLSPVGESDWQVWPSQGGHVDLAPTDDESLELLRFFMERHPEHVSAERALSGEGLLALQAFYRSRGLAGDTLTDPAQVSASGDDASRAAIRRFCQLLGAAAGNLGVSLLPKGGIYLAGGLPPRFDLVGLGLVEAFLAKGRMRPLLMDVPLRLVTDPLLGLRGAALLAAERSLAPQHLRRPEPRL
ncbi:MAG: glucokinase [Deltaproteobacteria bacterium]|nr:glucokinase [Deltaproteobacteria bacterium]MBK9647549.1 glucokinase [Deltaproteobacteria bacterium]